MHMKLNVKFSKGVDMQVKTVYRLENERRCRGNLDYVKWLVNLDRKTIHIQFNKMGKKQPINNIDFQPLQGA